MCAANIHFITEVYTQEIVRNNTYIRKTNKTQGKTKSKIAQAKTAQTMKLEEKKTKMTHAGCITQYSQYHIIYPRACIECAKIE